MVSNIPSCHYMLLMQPSGLKSSSNQFHVLFTCKITTATGDNPIAVNKNYMPVCWLEVSTRKVLRPVTSTQVSLGFPVSISKHSDSSQHSKLPLHASHVALLT